MKTHIAIVTDQQLANLLPLLADIPDKLLLLVSDKMHDKANAFERVIKKHSALAAVVVEQVPALPDSSIAAIQDYAVDLLAQFDEQNQQLVLNLSGGTKLMALALSQVFQEQNVTQIYLNTEHDKIETLWPAEQSSAPLQALLNTKQHIEAHGVTWRSADSEEQSWLKKMQARRELTFLLAEQLAKDTENTEKLIGQINFAGVNAKDKSKVIVQPRQRLKYVNGKMLPILECYNKHGLIDWDPADKTQITFCSEDAHRYATGGWLEEYFYLVAQQCQLDDCHSGIKITDDYDRKADLRNELDGAIAFNNRLLLAESKTSKLGKDTQKDSDIIYKLDSIAQHIGGLYCSRLLLSAVGVDHTTAQNRQVEVTKRAKSTGITILDGKNVIHLKKLLEHWKKQGDLNLSI